MAIDKFKRVIWRLEGKKIRLTRELRRAIMLEIGTGDRTIRKTIEKMQELGWLKRKSRWEWYIMEDEIY